MGKIISTIILLLILLQSFWYPKSLLAQSTSNCQITQDPPTLTQNVPPLSTTVPEDQRWFKFRIVVSDRSSTTRYRLVFPSPSIAGFGVVDRNDLQPDSEGVLRQSNSDLPGLQYQVGGHPLFSPTTHNFYVERIGVPGHYCDGSYTIRQDASGGILTCNLTFSPSNPNESQEITVAGTITPQGTYGLSIQGRTTQNIYVNASGSFTSLNLGKFNPGTYQLTVQRQDYDATGILVYYNTNCRFTLQIAPTGGSGSITPVGTPGPGGTGVGPTTPAGTPAAAEGLPCNDASRGPGFKTAIGCIHTSPAELVKDFMTFLVGISGGFAFLMMLLGAFQMLTSAGNPETLATGKDRFTSAIIGLLFVIFAVLLLQIIGFDILNLPGFKK